tara:strand:+ start:134 stop:397 length:264 start_codon:yes stop_codon:yes gene_type:complete
MAEKKKKQDKDTDVDRQSRQLGEMINILSTIEEHLASMVYYQGPSRGLGAGVEKTFAQPYINERKKLKDNIEELVIEELRKLNEENK